MFPFSKQRKIQIQEDLILVDGEETFQLKKDYFGTDYAGPRWSVWKDGRIILQDDFRCNISAILEYENGISYVQWCRNIQEMVKRGDKIAAIKQLRTDSNSWDCGEHVWRLAKALHVHLAESVESGIDSNGKQSGRYYSLIGLAEAKHLYEAFENFIKQTA